MKRLLFVFLALFQIIGCFVFAPVSRGKEVLLREEDCGRTVELRAGDIVQIELKGTPSAGFWWHFVKLDEEYLLKLEEKTRSISKGREIEGAPVWGIWILKAKKAGETTIEMAYYRRWEGVEKAIKRCLFKLQILP
ncbi:MAG: hypothetical protein DRI61_15315 [Chloroflexi bacterium]|nr:MAG: hypothetical protein DRI61_15315 [Chloroflexota bacterium]